MPLQSFKTLPASLPVQTVDDVSHGVDEILVFLGVADNDAVELLHVGVNGVEGGRLSTHCVTATTPQTITGQLLLAANEVNPKATHFGCNWHLAFLNAYLLCKQSVKKKKKSNYKAVKGWTWNMNGHHLRGTSKSQSLWLNVCQKHQAWDVQKRKTIKNAGKLRTSQLSR